MTETQVQQLVGILDQLAVLLLPLALSWAVAHWGLRQRAEATLTRQGLVGDLARTAVRAAEQALSGQDGAARKQYALRWLERAAEQHGITVTPEQLATFSGAIEAAVGDMHVGDALWAGAVKPAAPPAVMTPFVLTPSQLPDATITQATSPPAAAHDPTASKPMGAGTGVAW